MKAVHVFVVPVFTLFFIQMCTSFSTARVGRYGGNSATLSLLQTLLDSLSSRTQNTRQYSNYKENDRPVSSKRGGTKNGCLRDCRKRKSLFICSNLCFHV